MGKTDDKRFKKIVGTKIKELRIAKNLTQGQLGELLEKKANTITTWEKGLSSPDVDSISIMCQIFKVSVDTLFDWSKYLEQDIPMSGSTTISSDEKELLTTYRELNIKNQSYIRVRSEELLEKQLDTEASDELAFSKSVG